MSSPMIGQLAAMNASTHLVVPAMNKGKPLTNPHSGVDRALASTTTRLMVAVSY